MDAKRISVKYRVSPVAMRILAVLPAFVLSAGAIAREEWQYPHPYSQGYYERLAYYQSKYPAEIFDFCYRRNHLKIRRMRSCLRKQESKKNAILGVARQEMGSPASAQAVYDECRDYHPRHGVSRIGICVETRLMLHDKVGDLAVERVIYRKCEAKWHSSGAPAIDVCCTFEGNFYRDNGRLRD